MFERGSKKETLPRLCVVFLALSVPPVLWLWDLSPEIFAGCDAYGYGCSQVACFGLEATTDQGATWRDGGLYGEEGVYIFGWPGSTTLVHTRSLLGVISGDLDGWQFGVRHDGSAVTGAGGAFDLVAVQEAQFPGLKCGAPPDFRDTTEIRPCGYTQGILIDMSSNNPPCTVGAPVEVITSYACYRVTFPSVQGVYEVTLSFTDDVGDPPISSIVTQDGKSNVPCKYELTLKVYSTSYYYPTPSYCPLSQQSPIACPPPGGGGGEAGGGGGQQGGCQPAPQLPLLYMRGDTEPDGVIKLTDAFKILLLLFRGGTLQCRATADTDGKLAVELTDAVFLLNWLFRGGPEGADPFFPYCGTDADATLPDCAGYLPSCPDFPGPNVSRLWPLDQEETAVAVNSCHAGNIVVLSNHTVAGGSGNGPGFFRAVSFDGGVTWPVRGIVFESGGHQGTADPSLAFDAFGNVYAAYNGSDGWLQVAISTDGGVTFPEELRQDVATPRDHSTIATGPSSTPGNQSVWVVYHCGSDSQGKLCAAGAEVSGPLSPGQTPASFTTYDVADGWLGNGDIAVGPNGEVIVAYQDFTVSPGNCTLEICPGVMAAPIYLQLRGAAPPDELGVGFAPPTEMPIGTSKVCGPRGGQAVPAGDSARAGPVLDWYWVRDQEGVVTENRAYLAYVRELADESDDTDIYLRVGMGPDFGCWSTPRPVSDSAGVQTHHDIAINRSTDPSLQGRLVLTWYGTGNDPNRTTLGYFGTYSTGTVVDSATGIVVPTFKGAFMVSDCDGSGRLHTGNDYTSVVFRDDGSFFPCWGDNCVSGHDGWDVLVKRLAVEDCSVVGDEDGDGLADCDDPACCGAANCQGCAEDCSDGRDNDGDDLIDCMDPDCDLVATCPEDCDDGADNDDDTLVDCADPDCQPSCCPPPCVEVCDDPLARLYRVRSGDRPDRPYFRGSGGVSAVAAV